jgi:pilus assembly protein TadC
MLLLVLGCWVGLPPRSRARLIDQGARASKISPTNAAAVLGGLGAAVLLGGLPGVLVGVLVGFGARAFLQRLAADDSARRQALARQAPDAVDCLASCMTAGAPVWTGMSVVADAFGEPIAGVLRRCTARHAMGARHTDTFAELLADPVLAPVGRVLVRSVESGGALSTSLLSCAEHMRLERASELERRARAVGVKAVAPLGLCFLPAFVLLSVVPIVGSMVQTLF